MLLLCLLFGLTLKIIKLNNKGKNIIALGSVGMGRHGNVTIKLLIIGQKDSDRKRFGYRNDGNQLNTENKGANTEYMIT